MRKICYSDELPDALIKAAGVCYSLIENEHHIKQASSSAVSAELIRNHRPDKDHYAVHLIAMAADEFYGPNRNGDGWPEEMLKSAHPTFVSHGHYFREHQNTNPKLAIGLVKASAYNDPMHRVELIIWGDKKKSEEEYEAIKSGKELSFSMSARVPWDECSICKNHATKSAHYCGHLKDHMLQYLPQFKKFAYARNPKGTFFDISKVTNRADRIATYLQYEMGDELAKAASIQPRFIFSDEWAEHEGLVIPDEVARGLLHDQAQVMLEKLASAEQYIEDALKGAVPHDSRYQFFKNAVQRAFVDFAHDPIYSLEMTQLAGLTPDQLFGGLAKRAAVLPFPAFVQYCTGESDIGKVANDPDTVDAMRCLPRVFRMLKESSTDLEREKLFLPLMEKRACACPDSIDQLLDQLAQRYSVGPRIIRQRIINLTVMEPEPSPLMSVKFASAGDGVEASPRAQKLALTYGMYKVAACLAMEQENLSFLVDEPTSLLLTYHHLI